MKLEQSKNHAGGEVEHGGGIGRGDHFLPHIFMEKSSERWENTIKQLLNVGGGHQAPRKAAYSLWKEVGQNIKDKKKKRERERDKRVRDRDPSWGGSCEGGEVSEQQETLSLAGLWGVWNFRGQHNQEEKKNTAAVLKISV